MPFTYEFPRPAVAADCVLFTMRENDLAVLLVKRGRAPFKGAWALPGGFLEQDEAPLRAAYRELAEETGMTGGVALEQLHTFGDPGRDPRGHVISITHYAFLVVPPQRIVAGDDAADVGWYELHALPKLAFDHDNVIACARARLLSRLVEYPTTLGLPARFTLSELQRVYEAVRGEKLRASSFRAQLLARRVVEQVSSARRPKRGSAHLYRFKG